jgi:predicted Zn-dependent protease
MTAEDGKAAKPYVLRVVPMPHATAGQGFRELARGAPAHSGGGAGAEAQLRLLNRAYPSGEIEAGRLVKTLQ